MCLVCCNLRNFFLLDRLELLKMTLLMRFLRMSPFFYPTVEIVTFSFGDTPVLWMVTFLCFVTQGVVPQGAVNTVRELFVPESRKAEVQKEAETLPSVEITKVRYQERGRGRRVRNRQTDREMTDKQAGRQVGRQTYTDIDRHMDWQTET